MINTILVPLDRSPFSERALPVAECLARRLGARLVLAEAVSAHVLPGLDPTDAQVEAVDDATTYLNVVADGVRATGLDVEVATPYGAAAEQIVQVVSSRDADLVVMATHGRSGLGRWVYGSVAEGVLRSSPVPVLLLQAWHGSLSWRCDEETPLLIVPLDGSPFAEAALPLATDLARQLGAEMLLLQALDVPVEPIAIGPVIPLELPTPDMDTLLRQARGYLQQVAERITRESGLTPRIEVIEGGAASVIADVTREHSTALVVMSTHGRTGVGRVLFGSVAGATLRQSSAPLLLVRPNMPAAEAAPVREQAQANGAVPASA